MWVSLHSLSGFWFLKLKYTQMNKSLKKGNFKVSFNDTSLNFRLRPIIDLQFLKVSILKITKSEKNIFWFEKSIDFCLKAGGEKIISTRFITQGTCTEQIHLIQLEMSTSDSEQMKGSYPWKVLNSENFVRCICGLNPHFTLFKLPLCIQNAISNTEGSLSLIRSELKCLFTFSVTY